MNRPSRSSTGSPIVCGSARDRPRCTYKSLLIAEEAIAIELLIHCPIRRKNLTELHLERDFLKPGNGTVFLPVGRVQNEERQGAILCVARPAFAIGSMHTSSNVLACSALRLRLSCFRSETVPPRWEGQQLGKRISARIRKELGIDVHPHLFRHLSAMVLLREQPGHYELVRRILGGMRRLLRPITAMWHSKPIRPLGSLRKSSRAVGGSKHETDWHPLRQMARGGSPPLAHPVSEGTPA
jgi:hypothetical protein